MHTEVRVKPGALLVGLLVAVPSLAADYKVPRLPDGAPDLQGIWTNATATPIERPEQLGTRRAFTAAEAAAINKEALARVAADAAPSDPSAEQKAGDLPPVGNYNLFWTDRGMSAALIDGEYRTSVIIDPPNGQIPPLKNHVRPARSRGAADGPEQRGLGERCILSFGSLSGPPMLPTMYNSYYQIVQAPGYVAIMAEMVHDVRMIRIGGKHLPDNVRKWMGDSVGHWEGDTLVVVTKNFRPEQSYRGTSPNAVMTERFRRVAKDKIVYRFTVDDPTHFTAPFTGELPFTGVDYNIYEYACHEGNYALPGILLGEREREKVEAAKAEK
jgi:hypothetical protein